MPNRNGTWVARCAAGLLSLLLFPAWLVAAEDEQPAPAPDPAAVPNEDPVPNLPPEAKEKPAEEKPAAEAPAAEAPAAEPAAELPPAVPAAEIIKNFLEHMNKQEGVTAEQREAIGKLVESIEADPFSRDILITLAQREINPDFAKALDQMAEEKLVDAEASFEALTKSADPYLAAESSFFLARSFIMEDRYEQALPHLQAIGEKYAANTLHSPEALFLRGVAEVRVLKRKEAAATLGAFLKQYPDASERMKIAAWRMLDLLEQTEDGSLRDVQALMEYSRRRLSLEVPDKETQEAQDRAVALLEKLIEKAEEQESQGQGQGEGKKKEQGKSQGNNQSESQGSQSQSQSGQGGSNQNDQSADKVVRELRGGPKTPWDHLRNKKREEKAFAALKTQFPARYQRLVEQYFRSLQDEKEQK